MKSLRTKALAVSAVLGVALSVGLVSSYASHSKYAKSAFLRADANTIGGWRIKNDTLPQWKIVPGGIGHSRIGNKAIQANNLAAGAVTTNAIADGAVTTNQIADGSITAAKLDSAFLGSLFVVDPAATQTVVYGGPDVGTVLQMAAGATADPLEIQDSSNNVLFSVGPNGSFTADGGLIQSSGAGDLWVNGALYTDGGNIFTDGNGDLSVAGSISTDNGSITSDGAGNLTVNGDLTDNGTIYAEGSTDGFGNALVLDGGGLAISTPNYAGNFVDLGNGLFTVDSSGDLATVGSFSVDNNAIYSDGSGDLTVEGWFSTDNGGIYSDGNGNLWTNDLHIGGTLYCNNCVDLSSVASLDLSGHLTVQGYAWFYGDTHFYNGFYAGSTDQLAVDTSGNLSTSGNVTLSNGNLSVFGSISSDNGNIYSDGVNGNLTVNTLSANDVSTGTLESSGLATLDSLAVTNVSNLSGDLNVGSDFTVSATDGSIWADSGAFQTDGSGDLTIAGAFSSDNGNFTTDGNGNLTSVGSITASGELYTTSNGGTDLSVNGNFTVNGSNGAFTADAGQIYSDGNGNLTIAGQFTSDNGNFTSDGSGNVTVHSLNVTSTGLGAINVNGGEFTVNGGNGAFASDNGHIYSSGSGDLTINGNLTVGGLFSATGGLQVTGGLDTDTLTIGGGATITGYLSADHTFLAPLTLPAYSCQILTTVTVTGATTDDTVVATPADGGDNVTLHNLTWSAWVVSPNNVQINTCNPTGTNYSLNDNETWRVDVWQH